MSFVVFFSHFDGQRKKQMPNLGSFWCGVFTRRPLQWDLGISSKLRQHSWGCPVDVSKVFLQNPISKNHPSAIPKIAQLDDIPRKSPVDFGKHGIVIQGDTLSCRFYGGGASWGVPSDTDHWQRYTRVPEDANSDLHVQQGDRKPSKILPWDNLEFCCKSFQL